MNKFRLFLILMMSGVAVNAQAVLPDFVPLIDKHSKAVVNISTTYSQESSKSPKQRYEQIPFGEMPDFFKKFFDRQFRKQNFQQRNTASVSSLGSGMIISKEGYILTNHHVVNKASEIIVRLKDRREFKAKIIGSDRHTDIALIKIDAQNLPVVKIGQSKNIKVGEWVFAIGSPFGFDLSASAGIVSATGRSVPNESEYNYVPFIQTDVAINPGNSGGPLFNLKGEVVGVNSMIYSRSGGYMGVSFAIPIDVAINITKQLRQSGSVTRGWLGVQIQPVTHNLAQSFGMKKPEGSLIAEIISGSPADQSDLKVGDVILKFDGHKITHNSDLPPLVARTPINQIALVDVLRQGEYKAIKVKIKSLPTSSDQQQNDTSTDIEELGMRLGDVPESVRRRIKLKTGGALVSTVKDDSIASKIGIVAGDVIVSFDYKKVKSPEMLRKLIQALEAGESVPILLKRDSGSIFLAFKK